MREREFRAWDAHNKKMIHNPVCIEAGVFTDHIGLNDLFERFKNKGIILIEYTGLKDKDGKKIYEGDILERGLTIDIVVFLYGAFCIKFYSKGFKNTYIKTMYETLGCGLLQGERQTLNRWKIIGNIYENPEILNIQA